MGHAGPHKDKPDAAGILAEVASHHHSSDTIERVLVVTREMLDMDISFISEFTGEQMLFRKLSGDADSFGWREGDGVPLERTFCKQVIDNSLRNVIPDAQDDEWAKSLDIHHNSCHNHLCSGPLFCGIAPL